MASKRRTRAKRARAVLNEFDNDETVFNVLSICFNSAKLKQDTEMNMLARLSCSSKQLKAQVQHYVQLNVGLLLPPVAAQAHTAQKAAQERNKALSPSKDRELSRVLAQSKWICSMAGPKALTNELQAVLHVRRVPRSVTQQILATGVQLTTTQLVEAAKARVEGLDSWVFEPYIAHLPPLVQAIYGSTADKLKQLLPTLGGPGTPCLQDILHLAINEQRSTAAEALLTYLQQQSRQLQTKERQLQAQQLRVSEQQQRRMVTRRKVRCEQQQQTLHEEVQHLRDRVQQFTQQLDSTALIEALLSTAVARKHSKVVGMLCALPAAVRLPGDAVMRLLHRAVVHKAPSAQVLEQLLTLATATAGSSTASSSAAAAAAATVVPSPGIHPQLSVEAVAATPPSNACPETAAFAASAASATPPPTAQAATAAAVLAQQQQQQSALAEAADLASLLEAAVQRRNAPAVQLLARQPAAQLLDESVGEHLARTAVELHDSAVLESVSKIPAVQQLSSTAVQALLVKAVQLSSWSLVRLLCNFPGAAVIPAAEMAVLLHTAVLQGSSLVVERLIVTAPARAMNSEMLAQLLLAAVDSPAGAERALLMLCDLPSAGNIGADVLGQLLLKWLSLPACNPEVLSRFCDLMPAAAALQGGMIAKFLQTALDANNSMALHALCHLPCALQMSPSELYGILSSVLFLNRPTAHSIVQQLCFYLSAVAQQLSAEHIAGLLQETVRLGSSGSSFINNAVRSLVRLPGAQQIPTDHIAALAKASLRCFRARDILTDLLSLQPAQQLSMGDICGLVHSSFTADKLEASMQLLRLPAAKEMPGHVVADLLHALLGQVFSTASLGEAERALQQLCALPGAETISAQRWEGLLHAVLKSPARITAYSVPSPSWLQELLKLPAAQQLTPTTLESLLRVAIQRQPHAVKMLCQLPATGALLDAAAVERLLSFALCPSAFVAPAGPGSLQAAASQAPLVAWLVTLPACQDLAPTVLAGLIQSALQQGRIDALKCLCQLDAPCAKIDREACLGLLRSAVLRMTGKGVTCVSRLLNASGITRAEMEALLKLNEEMGHAFDQSLAALLQGLVR